jgi:pimeloyl-ACP methyl ester carboxylesterase
MPISIINGLSLNYELMGSGPPIIWLQGGRSALELMRPIAEPLSGTGYQCLIYDRRNCGASDILIKGDASEQEIWADELAALIRQLELAPAYLGGWSAGCRVALLTAIRYPGLVRGLLLGWVTGGGVAAQRLAHQYYGQFIEAALSGGMQAVCETPFFAERIQMNAGNRDRLMSMQPQDFIATMSRWNQWFGKGGDTPVIGATEAELSSIKAPTAIVAGDDDIHPLSAAQRLHGILPDSEFYDPPILREEWDRLSEQPAERDRIRAQRTLPIFTSFLQRMDTRAAVR